MIKKQELKPRTYPAHSLKADTKSEPKSDKQQLALIRIRGTIHVRQDIEDTLQLLKLYKKNFCVVYQRTPSLLGMIQKVKDYITWGEINPEVYEKIKARASGKKEKPFYRLNSPKKGYGRKGIKISFHDGGALGYRGEKINDLILRMA